MLVARRERSPEVLSLPARSMPSIMGSERNCRRKVTIKLECCETSMRHVRQFGIADLGLAEERHDRDAVANEYRDEFRSHVLAVLERVGQIPAISFGKCLCSRMTWAAPVAG